MHRFPILLIFSLLSFLPVSFRDRTKEALLQETSQSRLGRLTKVVVARSMEMTAKLFP